MSKFNYNDALDTLYGFINYELKRQDRYSPEVMTLDRPFEVMERLGNPHTQYPIVHITGTKGKGSVGAMCASVLQASGLRVGLYSSPHLQDFRERFRINNTLISREKLAKIVEDIRPHLYAVEGLTWFEVTTALAFEYFAREKIDIAVVEVGLGGRLDATNVVTPLVSVITSLSFDHTHLLGNTLASIATEKAGIIKEGVPVVSAPQPDEALAVIEAIAAERHAPLTLVGRDWEFLSYPAAVEGQKFVARHDTEINTFSTSLLGEHQSINGTVALATLQQVRQAGFLITNEHIQQGFQQVQWPGRLEIIQYNPPAILDAAHNRASARFLREALQTLYAERSLVLVYGAKADKDILGMLDELLPAVDTLILTQAVDSRAESLDHLAAIARQTGYTGEIIYRPIVGEAFRQAIDIAGAEGMVCVTGSLYVVGETRSELGFNPDMPTLPSTLHQPLPEEPDTPSR
jgi:dihydrofolate synthase/folylpolyglutamate synthase